MALIIVYLSLFCASIFGISAMAYLGDEFLTSKMVDLTLLFIVSCGFVSAILYEAGRLYFNLIQAI